MNPDTRRTATSGASGPALAGAVLLAEGRWPGPDDSGPPPPLTGFVVSRFSPMGVAAADRCLGSVYGTPLTDAGGDWPPAARARAERTAIVLASGGGDLETHTATAEAVDAGRAVAPLLFFQSVPNAVVGYVAKRWGLAGPVICFSPGEGGDEPLDEALDITRSLVAMGGADEALILLVDQVPRPGETGGARALLVRPETATVPGRVPS